MEIDYSGIKSIPATFRGVCNQRGDRIAMRHKEFGIWKEISWTDYYLSSVYVSHALMSLGVQSGDFVAILGENCPEWVYMDMGIQMSGASTVGIYTTNSWQQVQYILKHSECKILFAENEEQVDKWLQIKEDLPHLEYVIYWDKKGLERMVDSKVLFLDSVVSKGKESFSSEPDLHISRIAKVDPDDIAVLVYTSGTTGNPKGVMLTSRNILWVANQLQVVDNNLLKEGDETMSFLPLCHIYERMFSTYFHLTVGHVINFAESTDTIAQNLTEIRPTVGYAVPRVWEKFQSSMLLKIDDAPWLNRKLFKYAVQIGSRYTERKLNGQTIKWSLRAARFMAYWTVLYPLKYMIGMNRMRYALSAAAPIAPAVLRFYHMLGIPVIEAYGMTETSALITFSSPDCYKLGTVGRSIAEGTTKLADDGEILVCHPGVTCGYYKNPEATKESFTEGWLHTGDIGELDEDGFFTIVDRKKDIIITAGGKNIAPQKIESKLKFSPYINDAIVIGDKRKFLSAIIVLDEENVNKYAIKNKISYSSYSELATDPTISKLIDQEISRVNKQLARVEHLRKFTILDKRLYVEDGEVTPTMKVKRKFINTQYQGIIEDMYK